MSNIDLIDYGVKGIKPLRDMDGYLVWEIRVTCLLKALRLHDHIKTPNGPVAGDKRTEQVPSPDDPNVLVEKKVPPITQEEEDEWNRNDAIAFLCISRSLSDEAHCSIFDCDTAYSAWKALEAKYKPRGMHYVLKKYGEMVKPAQEGDDMAEHCWHALGCRNTLNAMGIEVPDNLLAVMLLASLPPGLPWSSLISNMEDMGPRKLDLHWVIRCIRDADEIIKLNQRGRNRGERGKRRNGRRGGRQ